MANFQDAIEWVMDHEGGFQKNPNDRGNYDYDGTLQGTRYGITVKVARDYGYTGRMEELPRDFAIYIYSVGYWPGLEPILDQAVATKFLDMRVNMGTGGGTTALQKALNGIGFPVGIDGSFGPITLNAVNSADPSVLMAALVTESINHYARVSGSDPTQEGFSAGWMTRAKATPPTNILEVIGEEFTDETGSISGVGILGVALLIGTVIAVIMARS